MFAAFATAVHFLINSRWSVAPAQARN